MTLGIQIAVGNTAEIFAWRAGLVLKLFHAWVPETAVATEREIARAVHGVGVPSPDVGEIVRVDDRLGIEYEHIGGKPLSSLIRTKPWKLFFYADMMAELQLAVNQMGPIEGVPPQRHRLRQRISSAGLLNDTVKLEVLQKLQRLPSEEKLCHGDFHPNNILMSSGRPLLVDWIDATIGDPASDVARTVILIDGSLAASRDRGPLERATTRLFRARYLSHYLSKAHMDVTDYQRWLPIVAAARLYEHIELEQNWLIEQVTNELNQ